jgi:hypothetical protein
VFNGLLPLGRLRRPIRGGKGGDEINYLIFSSPSYLPLKSKGERPTFTFKDSKYNPGYSDCFFICQNPKKELKYQSKRTLTKEGKMSIGTLVILLGIAFLVLCSLVGPSINRMGKKRPISKRKRKEEGEQAIARQISREFRDGPESEPFSLRFKD